MSAVCGKCGKRTDVLSGGRCLRCCPTTPPPPDDTIEITLQVRLPTAKEREHGYSNIFYTSEGPIVLENCRDLAQAARQLKEDTAPWDEP